MFSSLGEKTLYIFGIANVISIPMVWSLYPESNQRTLEEMDLLFAADSPWNWEAEKNFARLVEENPGLVQAARRGSSVVGNMENGAVVGAKKEVGNGDGHVVGLGGGKGEK